MRSKNKMKNNTQQIPYASPQERRLKMRRIRARKAKKIRLFAALIIIVLIALLVFNAAFGKNALNVKVGDTVVCTILKGNFTADDIKNTAQAGMAKELGTNIEIKDKITLEPVHSSKKKTVTEEYAVTQVKKAVSYNIEAGIIRVNGDKVITVASKATADKLLNDILSSHVKNGQTVSDYKFKLETQTLSEFVNSQEITSYDEAYKKLTQKRAEKRKYTVKSRDTIFGIASKYSMSLTELFTANPGLDENSVLQIGDVLNVTEQAPFLEVEYTGSKK